MSITYTSRLLKCDEPTPRSKKIYPTDEVKKAINDFMENSVIHLGEMDGDTQHINLDRVSHRINKTYVDDDGWWVAEIETIETPMGNILSQLLEAGIEPRLTPRSTGRIVDESKHFGTVSDLQIITIDVVAQE